MNARACSCWNVHINIFAFEHVVRRVTGQKVTFAKFYGTERKSQSF
jgi:hypothetical protein